jgi:hypothetical protein
VPPNLHHDPIATKCAYRLVMIRQAAVALAAAGLLAGAALAAPKPTDPASVAREWSAALNRGDDKAAGALFATNAVVVQGSTRLVLSTRRLAVLWNSGLPCAGRIVRITVTHDIADVNFVLGERPGHKCDAPGIKARAAFQVRNGKIVYWIQLPVQPPKPKPKPKPKPVLAA